MIITEKVIAELVPESQKGAIKTVTELEFGYEVQLNEGWQMPDGQTWFLSTSYPGLIADLREVEKVEEDEFLLMLRKFGKHISQLEDDELTALYRKCVKGDFKEAAFLVVDEMQYRSTQRMGESYDAETDLPEWF